MFEAWLEQEKTTIKERYGKSRVLCIIFVLLMIPFALLELILLLDGGGFMQLGALIFIFLVMILLLSLGNYKKRFIKPLLASVQQELPSETERQEFARQMQNGSAVHIVYTPYPQTKECDMFVAADYCYFRQPKRSRIIRNQEICRVALAQESYSPGTRGHIRWCYALTVFTSANEKEPIWRAYFHAEDRLYAALSEIKKILPPETVIQNDIAYGETKEGRQRKQRQFSLQIAATVLVVVILYFLTRYFHII